MPAPAPVTSAYQIAADAHYRRLDDEVGVYLADRFETHLLDDKAWQVLQAIQELGLEQRHATPLALAARLLALPDALSAGDTVAASHQASAQHADACRSLAPVLAALADIGVLTVSAC